MNDGVTLAILSAARAPDVTRVLARAFFDDPGFIHAFPDSARRGAHLGWLFERLFRANSTRGTTFGLVRDGGSILLSVASWVPPGRAVGVAEMARHGMLAVPIAVGLRSTARMLASFVVMEREKARLFRGAPHWLLDQLAVDPAHQRGGHGRRTLTLSMERCAEQASAPMLLFTSKERNVTFYRGAGFTVERETWVGGADGYRLWSMVKP